MPDPTAEDHQLEREYESNPKLEYNLEDIERKEASLSHRKETIWQVEENHEQTDNEEQLRQSTRISIPTCRMEQS